MSLKDTKIMGVLNVTPDSFSDGGEYLLSKNAAARFEQMVNNGADIIDIGAESSRPGSEPVSDKEQIRRLTPVFESIQSHVARLNTPISLDTRSPVVLEKFVKFGVRIINDINALQTPGMMEVVKNFNLNAVLVHMDGTPQSMQKKPTYDNVCDHVASFLERRINACLKACIPLVNIIIDPGIGFGKRFEDNIALLKNIPTFHALGCPVLMGVSKKAMLGEIINEPDAKKRVHASVAVNTYSALNGANIVRVHDVLATRQAFDVFNALL